MSVYTDNILESLNAVVYNRCDEYGDLKPHRIDLLIVVWLMIIGLGLIPDFLVSTDHSLKISLSSILSLISVMCVIIASCIVKKSDYRWFLYYTCNVCGGGLCVANVFLTLAFSIESSYRFIALGTFLFSLLMSGFVSYKITTTKVRNGTMRRKGGDNFEEDNLMSVGIALGCIGSCRKYDPHCEIMKQVKEEYCHSKKS